MWNFIIFLLIVLLISILGALVVGYYLSLAKLQSRLNRYLFNIQDELEIKADLIDNLLNTGTNFENEFEINNLLNSLNYADSLKEQAKINEDLYSYLENISHIPEDFSNKKTEKLIFDLNESDEFLFRNQELYNNTVYNYNHKLKVFPSKWVASYFGFKHAEYFTVEETIPDPQMNLNHLHPEENLSQIE